MNKQQAFESIVNLDRFKTVRKVMTKQYEFESIVNLDRFKTKLVMMIRAQAVWEHC